MKKQLLLRIQLVHQAQEAWTELVWTEELQMHPKAMGPFWAPQCNIFEPLPETSHCVPAGLQMVSMKKWQLYQLINAHCPMLKHTHQQKKIIHLFNPGTEHSLHPDCQGILLRKTVWPLPQSTLGSLRYLGYSTMFSESKLLKSAKHEGSWGGSLDWSW